MESEDKCKNRMELKNIAMPFIIILAMFGIFFLSGWAHEAYHIATGKGATAVCWNFNQKIEDDMQKGFLMFSTSFNPGAYNTIEEYHTWREYSEKVASVLTHFLWIIMGFLLGIFVMLKKQVSEL